MKKSNGLSKQEKEYLKKIGYENSAEIDSARKKIRFKKIIMVGIITAAILAVFLIT